MDVWFTRANGETLHNNPSNELYVQGEPPRFPEVKFDHTLLCLMEGFARIGWPASGDLRMPGWRERAVAAYGPRADEASLFYLEQFAQIRAGDLILLPAARSTGRVYLGVVQPSQMQADSRSAYYFHFNLERRDYYENAHRVDVRWAKSAGKASVFEVDGLGGGVWLKAFAAVRSSRDQVEALAIESGLVDLPGKREDT